MKSVLFFSALFFFVTNAIGQSDPVAHMKYFTEREFVLSEKYLNYMSQVAHGRSARKLEKKREELLNAIRQSVRDASTVRPYNGDATLKEAYKRAWDILYKVFNEDYEKIVDMEAIAEQSYDKMEAYLLAQDRAGEVLADAYKDVGPVYKAFAEKNNVKLIEAEDSKLEKKLKIIAEVNKYNRAAFLIFFKGYKQEAYTLAAANNNDLNALEQSNGTLKKFAEEGLAKVSELRPFNGDDSVLKALRALMNFYIEESDRYFPVLSEGLLSRDDFEKAKKAYDSKPASKRTQADVDAYNDAVRKVNLGVSEQNKLHNQYNTRRNKLIDEWNAANDRFMDTHVPSKRI